MSDKAILKKAHNLLTRCQTIREDGDPNLARQLVKETIQGFDATSEPDSLKLYAELWYELGLCQEVTGREEHALTSFEHSFRADPQATDAAVKLVKKKINSENAMSNSMVPLYLACLGKDVDRVTRHGALRRLQQILRIRLVEKPAVVVWRMEMLQKVHDAVPELNFPKLYLGRGYYLHEQFEAAIEILMTLGGKTRDSHNVLNMMARAHEKIGQLDAAFELFSQSLKSLPGQAGVHFRLGRLGLRAAEL